MEETNISCPRAKPTHYTVSLYDLEFGGNFTYKGTVSINLKITKDEGFTNLLLNAYQLKVHSAELKTGDKASSTKDVSFDDKRQRVTLDFGETIKYSGEATLEVKFEGTINNVMAGFYRSKYKPKGDVPSSVAKDDEYH